MGLAETIVAISEESAVGMITVEPTSGTGPENMIFVKSGSEVRGG